jgi:prepilin-type N-terminal cleavage/methylation domain-containing protein
MIYSSRKGVTLVEVLVVIVILAIAVFLLMPTIYVERGPTRRTNCMNNQKQLSLALIMYDDQRHVLPGYVQDIGSGNVSWVVAILPQLERGDLYKTYKSGKGTPAYIPMLVCPTSPSAGTTAPGTLSYAANCGMLGDKDTPGTSVFFNHSAHFDPLVDQTLKYIGSKDGTSNTILVTENLGHNNWGSTSETEVGVVYDYPVGINGDPGGQHPRPASAHPRGVVVACCDGSVRFLRDDISPELYQQLMAPDDAEAFKDKGYPAFDPKAAFSDR